MSKPDKPGVYRARDGRVAVSYFDSNGCLSFALREPQYGDDLNFHDPGDDALEGDWLPYGEPEFPPLPPKPRGGLCYCDSGLGPRWRFICEHATVGNVSGTYDLSKYIVIPLPDNDPEAVAMIEAAQRPF